MFDQVRKDKEVNKVEKDEEIESLMKKCHERYIDNLINNAEIETSVTVDIYGKEFESEGLSYPSTRIYIHGDRLFAFVCFNDVSCLQEPISLFSLVCLDLRAKSEDLKFLIKSRVLHNEKVNFHYIAFEQGYLYFIEN